MNVALPHFPPFPFAINIFPFFAELSRNLAVFANDLSVSLRSELLSKEFYSVGIFLLALQSNEVIYQAVHFCLPAL